MPKMYTKSNTRSSLISQAVIRIASDMGIESYIKKIRHGYSVCTGEFVIVDMLDDTSVKIVLCDYNNFYQTLKRNLRKWRKNYEKKKSRPCR